MDPKKPWPDYPRPQMARADWLNLNGIWQYQPGAEGDAVPAGRTLSSEILVPYPVESALSGVMEHHDRLWYRRSFIVPPAWKGKRVLLNFGAVDFESEVYINGKSVGVHRGGYLPFSYDVTPYLKETGPQELIVRVFDRDRSRRASRAASRPLHPGGIMYTPTTGIWQTVWLEPVARTSVQDLKIVPDIDARRVSVTVNATAPAPDTKVVVTVMAAGAVVKTVTGRPGAALSIPDRRTRSSGPRTARSCTTSTSSWSRDGAVSDQVRSYFGMRKISIGVDHGVKKMFLNNKFVFEIGPLDQGFWPDGIYTQPTEAALKADIQAMKTLRLQHGPQAHQGRAGPLVLLDRQAGPAGLAGHALAQLLPAGGVTPPPVDKPEFEAELRDMVKTHWNSPSIIMWDIFNEGQGQFDTPRLVEHGEDARPLAPGQPGQRRRLLRRGRRAGRSQLPAARLPGPQRDAGAGLRRIRRHRPGRHRPYLAAHRRRLHQRQERRATWKSCTASSRPAQDVPRRARA